jgi:hypothetical protein
LAGNYFLPVAIAANFAVDYISQRSRGDIIDQVEEGYGAVVHPENCHKDVEKKSAVRANWYGKTKTAIQTTVSLSYLGLKVYQNHFGELPNIVNNGSNLLFGLALLASATFGAIGVVKRLKNRKTNLEEIVKP